MIDLVELLRKGDLRTTGESAHVAHLVEHDLSLFSELFALIFNTDPGVRMRAADAAEKVTAKHPELLAPLKVQLLAASKISQQEVQWHIAQMLSRVELTECERDEAVKVLTNYLHTSESEIVKAFSVQTLSELALKHLELKSEVTKLLQRFLTTGKPATRAKARKFIKLLAAEK